MPDLIITRGCPGSGKSFWATKYAEHNSNTLIVCRDDIRIMLGSQPFSKKIEKIVETIRDTYVAEALDSLYDVIVADTNLLPFVIDHWAQMASKHKSALKFMDFPTPLEVCIVRDANREHSVGETVVRHWYDKAVKMGIYEHPLSIS